MALGFYCRTREEFEDFVVRARELGAGGPTPVFSVEDRPRRRGPASAPPPPRPHRAPLERIHRETSFSGHRTNDTRGKLNFKDLVQSMELAVSSPAPQSP